MTALTRFARNEWWIPSESNGRLLQRQRRRGGGGDAAVLHEPPEDLLEARGGALDALDLGARGAEVVHQPVELAGRGELHLEARVVAGAERVARPEPGRRLGGERRGQRDAEGPRPEEVQQVVH